MKKNKKKLAEANMSLRILGDSLNPNLVTSLLNITPTKAYQKGEKYLSKGGSFLQRPTSTWVLSTEDIDQTDDMNHHAVTLLELLKGKSDLLKRIKKKDISISITMWWEPKDGHGNFMIESKNIINLCMYTDDLCVYTVLPSKEAKGERSQRKKPKGSCLKEAKGVMS